jgi:hypothetical protein
LKAIRTLRVDQVDKGKDNNWPQCCGSEVEDIAAQGTLLERPTATPAPPTLRSKRQITASASKLEGTRLIVCAYFQIVITTAYKQIQEEQKTACQVLQVLL